jgi:hypothetical protein
VIGHSSAARAFEALGRFDEALAEYRLARAAWDDDHGREYSITSSQAPLPRQTVGSGPITRPVDPTIVTKVQLDERVAMLTRAFAMPGGAILMRGRGELDRGQFADARATFARFLKDFPGSVSVGDARELMHRAQLERALQLASPQNPAADMSASAATLTDLAGEPFDTLLESERSPPRRCRPRAGQKPRHRPAARGALTPRRGSAGPPPRAAAGSIEADIVAIRDLVFTPTGNLAVFSGVSWNAFEFPRQPPLFMVVSADIQVRLFDRTLTTPRVYQRYAGLENIVQLTTDELAILERVIPTLGGTVTRPTRAGHGDAEPAHRYRERHRRALERLVSDQGRALGRVRSDGLPADHPHRISRRRANESERARHGGLLRRDSRPREDQRPMGRGSSDEPMDHVVP